MRYKLGASTGRAAAQLALPLIRGDTKTLPRPLRFISRYRPARSKKRYKTIELTSLPYPPKDSGVPSLPDRHRRAQAESALRPLRPVRTIRA